LRLCQAYILVHPNIWYSEASAARKHLVQDDKERPAEEQPVTQKKKLDKADYVLIVISLLTVIAILFTALTSPERVERAARNQLRKIGSAELAYQQQNLAYIYGSLGALQETGYWPDKSPLNDGIREYWIILSVPKLPDRFFELNYAGLYNSTFTALAYPVRPARLSTFAIKEDQIVREYNPSHGNRPDSFSTWDPVL
jgi:hypothetical protein